MVTIIIKKLSNKYMYFYKIKWRTLYLNNNKRIKIYKFFKCYNVIHRILLNILIYIRG